MGWLSDRAKTVSLKTVSPCILAAASAVRRLESDDACAEHGRSPSMNYYPVASDQADVECSVP